MKEVQLPQHIKIPLILKSLKQTCDKVKLSHQILGEQIEDLQLQILDLKNSMKKGDK